MKQLFVLSFFAILSFTWSSCDKCSSVKCINSIGCEDGTCICEQGYEGATCKNKANHKFLGAYDGRQNCDNNTKVLEISHVVSGEKPYEVTVVFNNNSVKATVKETQIDFFEQDILFNGDSTHILPTNGKLTGKQLVFSIHTKDKMGAEQTCVYNFTKKQ